MMSDPADSTDASKNSNAQQQPAQQQLPAAPQMHQSHEGEHHGDFGNVPVALTRATCLYALCAALNSCNLGYDIGMSTNAGSLIQDDFGLSNRQREVLIGSLNFWAIFGGFMANFISDRFGRRRSFIVAAVGFIVGVVIMAIAPNYSILLFGRLFVGLGVGFGLAIDPLYISEITPAKHRGELVTWAEIALNIGIVLGFATGLVLYPMNDNKEWRLMFGLGAIMPVIMIYLASNVMPESPRWLVANHRDNEARVVLEQIYPPDYDVTPVVQDIKEALEREQAAERAVGWDVIISPTPAFRRMLLVGITTAIAQQAVGIDAIQYYLIDVLEESGVKNAQARLLILIMLGLIKLAFIVVGGKLFDRRGRRPLFFASLAGCAGALILISITFALTSNTSTGFTVFGLSLYLAFFSIGLGPGAWLIPSEVFATCIRAKAMSVATTVNRITATIMASTFLSVATAMTWEGFFFLLAIISILFLAFFYFYLPETKGRSLEDMSIYFAELTGDTSILEAEARILERDAAVAAAQGPAVELSGTTNVEPTAAQGTLT